MKTKLSLTFLAVLFLAVSCGKKTTPTDPDGPQGTEEFQLVLNLTEGKKYDMNMVMNTKMEMNMMGQAVNTTTTMDMNMDYEIMNKMENGNYLIRSTYKTVKMNGEAMGTTFSYDSETDKAEGPRGEDMSKNMKKMIGEYMEMEMDPSGTIVKTTYSEGMDKEGNGGGMMDGSHFSVFPSKKVKVGETWESEMEKDISGINVKVKTTYKLESVENGIATISSDGTFSGQMENGEGSMEGTQKGTNKIDMATGMNVEIDLTQDLTMEIDKMGMKMPMKMINEIKITTKE